MNLCALHLLTLAFLSVSVPCFAQMGTGTVTFYSVGPSAKEGLKVAVVPAGTIPFAGWLFDGNQRMAHAQRGRFITIHLAAGEHEFTAPYHSDRPGKTRLKLAVESGGQYCVRLSAKYISGTALVPIEYVDSQIEQVSCGQAVQEAGSYKRIDLKRIDPAFRTELDRATSFVMEK